jgi:hypothetical protein
MIIYMYLKMWIISKEKKWIFLLNNISMTIVWKKKNSNTWVVNEKTFVGNTRINKIYISYLKLSFDLWIYIIQNFFQYIIILLIIFKKYSY